MKDQKVKLKVNEKFKSLTPLSPQFMGFAASVD